MKLAIVPPPSADTRRDPGSAPALRLHDLTNDHHLTGGMNSWQRLAGWVYSSCKLQEQFALLALPSVRAGDILREEFPQVRIGNGIHFESSSLEPGIRNSSFLQKMTSVHFTTKTMAPITVITTSAV